MADAAELAFQRLVAANPQAVVVGNGTSEHGSSEQQDADAAELAFQRLVAANPDAVVFSVLGASSDPAAVEETLARRVVNDAAVSTWLESKPEMVGAPLPALTPSGWLSNSSTVQALRAGQLLRLEQAFDDACARSVHTALGGLPEEAWSHHASRQPGFQYAHSNIYCSDASRLASACPAYATACRWFEREGLTWFEAAFGCRGRVVVSASWYREGDYSTPHCDLGDLRRVAFVWHLTGEWDERSGGDLVWCSPHRRFAPSFNTLFLFPVHGASHHFVQPVAAGTPRAHRRLAINGWFCCEDEAWEAAVGSAGLSEAAVQMLHTWTQ